MNNWTRKDFLKASMVGGGAALLSRPLRAAAPGRSANGDIRVAVVGLNGQGRGHMLDHATKLKGSRLVAICDVDTEVMAARKAQCVAAGVTPATFVDYRKVLEDKNIDAVVLCTPNHQHSLQTIWGLQAGKDVFVEKPLSHNVWEGRQAVEAARKYTKNIAFAGTQNRSSADIVDAIAYVKSGKIGKIKWARALCYKMRESIGRTHGPQVVPPSIDYDLWTGPAWLTPPTRNGSKGPVHYDWHWFWNYGGGDITNQGIHQMDVARWFLGEPGLPPTVMSFGGRFGYQDDAETPNTLISVLGYEKAPLIFEVRGLPMRAGMRAMDAFMGTNVGVVVQCEGGYVTIGANGGAVVYDNDRKRLEQFAKNTLGEHRDNFIKAVQDRKPNVYGSVDECHYSSALCHIANVSYILGAEKSNAELADAIKADANTKDSFDRMLAHLKANNVDPDGTQTVVGPLLNIDGKKEIFVGSERAIVDAANKNPLLKREGRGAFKIPRIQAGAIAAS
jgi:predicted dehydrogenase